MSDEKKLGHIKFETWSDFSNWTFSNIPLCGCGDPDLVIEHLAEALRIINAHSSPEADGKSVVASFQPWNEWAGELDKRLYWMTVYALDDAGLTEHGAGLSSGGWITDLGREWLACLDKWGSATEEPGELT